MCVSEDDATSFFRYIVRSTIFWEHFSFIYFICSHQFCSKGKAFHSKQEIVREFAQLQKTFFFIQTAERRQEHFLQPGLEYATHSIAFQLIHDGFMSFKISSLLFAISHKDYDFVINYVTHKRSIFNIQVFHQKLLGVMLCLLLYSNPQYDCRPHIFVLTRDFMLLP